MAVASMASGSAPFAAQPTVGTLGFPATSVGPPGAGNLAYWDKGVLVGFLARGAVSCQEVSERVEVSLVREGLARLWVGCWFLAQQAVIKPTHHGESLLSGKAVVLSGGGKGCGGFRVLELVGCGLRELHGRQMVRMPLVEGGVQDPVPVGLVLSQRDQALHALKVLAEVLGPEVGPQVVGMVEGLLPQKPASLVPATSPTHAEMVARLHELHASEKRLTKKVEEAKGAVAEGKG